MATLSAVLKLQGAWKSPGSFVETPVAGAPTLRASDKAGLAGGGRAEVSGGSGAKNLHV